jgi:hypothetical protein
MAKERRIVHRGVHDAELLLDGVVIGGGKASIVVIQEYDDGLAGLTDWRGRIDTSADLWNHTGSADIVLRLAHGRSGRVLLKDSNGNFLGNSSPPLGT